MMVQSEIEVLHVVASLELRSCAGQHHLPRFQHVSARRELERQRCILLRQKHAHAAVTIEPREDLEDLRDEINKIDEVIVRLLDSRARCAYAVGRLKHQLGRPIYEPAREAAVIAHVRQVNESLGGPLDGDAVARLYERIMDEARRIQRLEAERDARENEQSQKTEG